MTPTRKLLERGTWRLRHAASLCFSTLGRGLSLAESVFEQNKERLVILDEIFPSLLTGFRIAEFNAILRHFPSAIVYSSHTRWSSFRGYSSLYPDLANQIRRFSPHMRLNGTAAYVVFLHNIAGYLEKIEQARLPFVFELYPGGGLNLNEANSDAKLSRVFASPMFRKVIVTQNITRDYILRKKLCRRDQIEFVFGVVVSSNVLSDSPDARFRYGINKNSLDICFIANRYIPGGLDKGYDRFIASARILSKRHPEARFHVVGQFTEEDCDAADLRGKITFYGHRPTTFFPGFHSRMDIILSPNVHSVLGPGAFDGFPTGCCIEAALCGTAMFVTDELGMNEGYLKDGEEIVIISREPDQIADTIGKYIHDPGQLSSIAQRGQKTVRRLFSLDVQMPPRLRVLCDLLASRNSSSDAIENTGTLWVSG